MGSSKGKDGKLTTDSGKYARYTTEQVEVLESIYNDCPKPSSARRQQIIRECPILANVGQKQLKVWFQNRRCREKQRKETGRLQSWALKLNAMHQLLLEENDRLQKQAAHLSSENQYLRQQLHLQHPQVDLNYRVSIAATHDTSSESVVTSGLRQRSPQYTAQGWNVSQLSAVAEMTLTDFLAKATGGMVNGIPLPGMKPGPDSVGAVALPRTRGGVAAQACDLVDLGAFKVADIIKNRSSWLEDCRKQVIVDAFTAERGGLVELVHTQMYAPTASMSARDFWTLRYTCLLENGNLVVCEGSLTGGQGLPEVPSLPGFVRAEMLPSGVLIRPCEHGGSLVMVLDDMNFLIGGLSDGACPLYETSTALAWRVTYKILCHLRGVNRESSEVGVASNQISSVQGFRHRLVRGFNDAINCFPDDGWVALVNDGPSSVSVHINPSQPLGVKEERMNAKGGLICAKASLPLHNVPSSVVMHLLNEHWTTWADMDGVESQVDLSRATMHNNVPERKFSTVKAFQPISVQNEVLEVVRLHKLQESETGIAYEAESFLLQLCSGMKDITASAAPAYLIFAHIDASVPDDAPLVPSGFRVMQRDPCTENLTASTKTLDLASSLEDRSATLKMQSHLYNEFSSALTIAFQYTYDIQNRNVVALRAKQNVQAILDFLQQAAATLHPQPPSLPLQGSDCHLELLLLVQNITESYRIHFAQDLLPGSDGDAEGLFKLFWNFQHAVVCCAWKPLPELIFANNSALGMLETSLSGLHEMSLERMFNEGCRKTDYSQPPPFLKEGSAHLPAGVCLTNAGHHVSYERATGWKVITGDQSVQIAAFLFVNWCSR